METVELGNGRSPGIEDRKIKGNAWAQGQWCQDMLGARKVLQLLLWEMQMEQEGQNSVAISEHQERHHRTQVPASGKRKYLCPKSLCPSPCYVADESISTAEEESYRLVHGSACVHA